MSPFKENQTEFSLLCFVLSGFSACGENTITCISPHACNRIRAESKVKIEVKIEISHSS